MAASLKHLSKDGYTQISGKNWADAFAGVSQTAEKFCIENSGDRVETNLQLKLTQVGSNDGSSMMRIGADTATISRPYGVSLALSGAGAGGVFTATGIYYYLVAAYNATGETPGSIEVSVDVDVTTKKVTISWTAVAGATGYKVFRSTSPGSYGASSLRANVSGGGSNQYIDDGDSLSAGTPLTANTSGGASPNYGTPPALGGGPITVGNLAIGQQWFYWANRIIPGGTAETGNPRLSLRQFVES